MRIGYFLSSEEFDSRELATPAPARTGPVNSHRSRGLNDQSPKLTSVSEAAWRLLRHTPPIAQPVISRAGVRSEAHRVYSILRATIEDQQLNGGK